MPILPVVGNVPMNQLAQMIMKPSSETQGQYKLVSSSFKWGSDEHSPQFIRYYYDAAMVCC